MVIITVVDPRGLPLMFGQNWVSNCYDIVCVVVVFVFVVVIVVVMALKCC